MVWSENQLDILGAKPLRLGTGHVAARQDRASLSGASEAIRDLNERVGRIAAREELPPVLIFGPSGSGKGRIARSLHERSARVSQIFCAVNCAAITDSLFEAEVFGYERGAFTGALEKKAGLFEAAARGVLFLDEIGDLPLSQQAKVLRVLEEKTFRRVGGVEEQRSDAWVIAATNADLEARVRAGTFREDLFYRLGLTLRAPALAGRGEDIRLLAQMFAAEQKPPVTISSDALDWLEARPWRGNVRELRSVIAEAAIFCDGTELALADVLRITGESASDGISPANMTLLDFVRVPGTYKEKMRAFGKIVGNEAIERCGGNHSAAARLLHVGRNTLGRILRGRLP